MVWGCINRERERGRIVTVRVIGKRMSSIVRMRERERERERDKVQNTFKRER